MRAARIGASLAALALLIAGCGGASPGSPPVEPQPKPEKTKLAPPSLPQVVRAGIGEPVDVGPSVIEVVAAHKTRPDPAKGYGGEHHEGVFVAVEVDVANDRKEPFEIPMDLPWYLFDSEGRSYAPDTQGYVGTYTFPRDNLTYAEEMPLVNTAGTVHLAEAYPVAPERVDHYVLQASDPACPQCGKLAKITIPGDLAPPQAPASAPATAVPSASASSAASVSGQ